MSGSEARVNEDRERRTAATTPSSAAAQVREGLAALHGSRQHALLRWPELIGLGASGLMVLAVLFAYFYFLLPANSRLAGLQSEREELRRKILASKAGAQRESDAQATATEISESLRDFEAAHLPPRSAARTEILQELTGLIAANKLQQSSAMIIAANDATTAGADPNPNRPRRANDGKDQSIFPGTDISFSVEGSYANLRSFVRDVEASKQFITIKSVEFQSSAGERPVPTAVEETDDRPAAPFVAQNPVTLHLKLGAYFQRSQAGLTPAPAGGTNNAAAAGQ